MDQKNILREFLKSNTINTKFGKIDDIKLIGEGANGLVFSGKIHDLEVAVKFLTHSDKKKLNRFKAEYLYINYLPSNNLLSKVIFYDELTFKNISFPIIVMKRYSGHLTREKNITPSLLELESLFNFLLDTLEFIHQNGIIHRDIKPQNILINGDSFVLGDFGIASYNPENFKNKIVETKEGERLGNYLFSAPEQSKAKSKAHKTMDIFSLGQICQWYASGNIHRGTNKEPITNFIPGSEHIDYIINKCLDNNPQNRFQTVEEIREALIEYKTREDDEVNPWPYLREFEDALAATFPRGIGKISYTKDESIIERLLNNLIQRKFSDELWYIVAEGDFAATFNKLNKSVWMIDHLETKINELWAYFHPSLDSNLILLHLSKMPPFEIYENSDTYQEQEAALVDDKFYISRTEFDSGYAEVGGEVLKLSEHKVSLRSRYLTDKYMILTTRYNCAFQRESRDAVEAFLEALDQGKTLINSTLRL